MVKKLLIIISILLFTSLAIAGPPQSKGVMPKNLRATNSPTDTDAPIYDATTGKFTWTAYPDGTDYQTYDSDLDDLAGGISGMVLGNGNGNGYEAGADGTDYWSPTSLPLLDEDDMASNSATSVVSQQSLVAYIAANSGGDVSGPGSSTQYHFPYYDDATGKLLGESSLTDDGSGNISGANSYATNQGTSGGGSKWYEGSGNGTNFIGFFVPDSITTSNLYILPDAIPSNYQFLVWPTPAGGKSQGQLVTYSKEVAWTIHDSDDDTAVADGKQAFSVPASMNGMELTDVTCSVADLNSASGGSTTVVLRRVRSGTPQDMTSTGVTIDYDAYTASDEVVNTSYDDLTTGDNIYVDINAVTTGAVQKGLSCTAVFSLP